MPLMDLLADWTEERSSELECYQQKPPKQKRKENKTGRKKNITQYPRTAQQLQKVVTYM